MYLLVLRKKLNELEIGMKLTDVLRGIAVTPPSDSLSSLSSSTTVA